MALTVALRNALAADLESIRAVVREALLPSEGIEEQFPDAYVVATAGGALVGVAGLEVYGGYGLLRSVAVQRAFRGAGLGRKLVENRSQYADCLGLAAVFLLTTSAAPYFEAAGFRRTARSEAPQAIARSSEFSCVCPETALCLVREPPISCVHPPNGPSLEQEVRFR